MGDAFDPKNPATVSSKTCHASSNAPVLGLERNLNFSHRVYLLKCSPQIVGGPFCWYVGVSDDVKKRLMEHFAGKGAKYTREHPPISIELVWPASSESVEAYVFAPTNSCIGGPIRGLDPNSVQAQPTQQVDAARCSQNA